MKNEPIRVLLVDDSMLVLVLLRRLLSVPGTGIEVVGIARDGTDALRKIPELDPQVICTDLQMPGMNGLELTRNVMARHPRPILVLSSAVEKGKHDDNIFKLLEAGAVDILPKPRGALDGNLAEVGKDLVAKIRLLSGVKTFTRRHLPVDSSDSKRQPSTPPASQQRPGEHPTPSRPPPSPPKSREERIAVVIPYSTRVIAIGASTGGPHALHTILCGLAPKLSIPVVCIQHVSAGFTEDLVDWLNISCPLTVRVARMGESLAPRTVYFPPDDKHLLIDHSGFCTTTTIGLIAPSHKPSITFAFNSIAKYYGSTAVGILLTGMGSDGADGLLTIRKAGGMTIAQDETSSVVFGMPKVAAEIGAAQHILSLPQIAQILGSCT